MNVNKSLGWGSHSKANLLKEVLFQIGTKLVPNFDMRYMQGITKFLDVFRFASRRCSQREYSEMRILVHKFSDNLSISVVPPPLMRLV